MLRILVALAGSFVGIEILLIVADPWLSVGPFQFDAQLGFRGRPYYGGANRFGFDDVDYPLQKPPGNFRVLVLGDSYDWGAGRDGNYSALLERKLEQHYGTHVVDVIRAGYPGTHTGDQLALLKAYGLHYHPDLVVLGFQAIGDFADADPYRRRVVLNGAFVDLDVRSHFNIALWNRPIVPRSRLWVLISQSWQSLREAVRKRRGAGPQGAFSEERFLDLKRTQLEFCSYRAWQQGTFNPRIAHVGVSITALQQLLRQRRIGMLVVIYPDELTVNERVAQELFSRFRLDPKDYQLDCAHLFLHAYLSSISVPFVDLLDDFKREEAHQELYRFRDRQWSAAGNQLAADVLFPRLLEVIEQHRSAAQGEKR